MHLHCHLKEGVIDCGPVHAFWCFSFEQFNGILGAMQVNGRSVEIQPMRKLLTVWFAWDVKFPSEFQEHFWPFFPKKVMIYLKIQLGIMPPFNSVYCLNLGDFQLSDLTLVSFPSFPDELRLLFECYKASQGRN